MQSSSLSLTYLHNTFVHCVIDGCYVILVTNIQYAWDEALYQGPHVYKYNREGYQI